VGFLFRRSDPISRLLTATGPTRCLQAIEVLQTLAGKPERIPAAWERIELPLLRDLPDCPPDAKPALMRALEDCGGACRNRDVARRIMVLRDSLVG
jgi:hypothetical protein